MAAAADLVMQCFQARTNAHVFHLQTKSYAAHKALEEFYEGVIDLADKFAEAYQGSYGVIDDYPDDFEFCKDAFEMIDEFEDWIGENREDIGDKDDTHLQNIIDEIVALARSTRYKLRTFK